MKAESWSILILRVEKKESWRGMEKEVLSEKEITSACAVWEVMQRRVFKNESLFLWLGHRQVMVMLWLPPSALYFAFLHFNNIYTYS